MIKKYLETRRLKKRERVLTARLDALWDDALQRKVVAQNTEKWRDTRDFFKPSEETNYDAWASEHFRIAKKLGIESKHFDPKRHDPENWGEPSPKALTTVRYDNHDVVEFKEENGFFVLYRNGQPDPNVDPVPVQEWNNVIVDIDEEEVRKNTEQRERMAALRERYGFPRPKKQSNPPL